MNLFPKLFTVHALSLTGTSGLMLIQNSLAWCLVLRRRGKRVPGAYCLGLHQVPMVTCILLRYTTITTNLSLPSERPHCRAMFIVRHIWKESNSKIISLNLMVTVWIGELQGKEKITSLHVVATRKNGQVILQTEELCTFINPSSLLTQSVVDGMYLPHRKTG